MLPSHQDRVIIGDKDGVETERLRVFTLSGFWNQMLNQEYVENREWAFSLCGRSTYWSRCSSFFMSFEGAKGRWILASAASWMEIKLLRGGIALACGTMHDSAPSRWHEAVATKKEGLVWNPAAGCSQGECLVDLQVKAQDLLATIPGACTAAVATSRQPLTKPLRLNGEFDSYTVKDFVEICTILQNLPADDGRLASALQQENLSGFDAVFACFCASAVAVEVQASKLFRPLSPQEEARQKQELQRMEKQSRKIADQLIAEEERENRAMKKKVEAGNLQSKKKKPKARKGKRPEKAASQADANVVEASDEETQTHDFNAIAFGGEDVSEPVARLQHNFPMFDDEVLSTHLMAAAYDMEEAVLSLSKFAAEGGDILGPVDLPVRPPRVRAGKPQNLVANVVARTDHPGMPLYCFVAMVAKSASPAYRPGRLVRPIPEDRFRLLGDEKGRFWLKKSRVPEIGDIVEIHFFEEDASDYLESAHGDFPHQNEDLLCTELTLRSRCVVERNAACRKSSCQLNI